MAIRSIMFSRLRFPRPRTPARAPAPPVVVKPVKRIEVKQYGLATGKVVRVRVGKRHKIEVKYIET